MSSEDSQNTPLGILLITTFWIFLATYFFLLMNSVGRYNIISNIIFILLGTAFVILAWGILILKPLAIYCSIVISFIGLFFSGFFLISFLSVFIYLVIRMKQLIKKPQNIMRFCPICGQNVIPGTRICPGCKQNFEEKTAKK